MKPKAQGQQNQENPKSEDKMVKEIQILGDTKIIKPNFGRTRNKN